MDELTTDRPSREAMDASGPARFEAGVELIDEPLPDGSGWRRRRRVVRFVAEDSASINDEAGDAMRRLLSG